MSTDRIFMSYARHDEAFARKLAAWLQKTLNLGVWIDVDDIVPGVKWSSAVEEGLNACEVMIVIITPESMNSRNVEDEWQYFLDLGKPVIPLLLRSAVVPYQLRRIQYIDFSVREEYNDSLRQLISEIRLHVSPLPHEDGTRVTPGTQAVRPTPSRNAIKTKERIKKSEDLIEQQARALRRSSRIVTLLAVAVLALVIAAGGFILYLVTNPVGVFAIRQAAADAIAYLPGQEQGVLVSELQGEAPIGTRFETGSDALELTTDGGGTALVQAQSSATINELNEERVDVALEAGGASVDAAGNAASITTNSNTQFASNAVIGVEIVGDDVSAACYEGTCSIRTEEGEEAQIPEGQRATLSNSNPDLNNLVLEDLPGGIVFITRRHGTPELYLMTPSGTSQTRITQNGEFEFSPAWAADASKIVYQTTNNGNNDIAIMNPDGSEAEILTGDSFAQEREPSFSPDASRIVFVSTRDGNDEIYVMNADGSGVQRLTNDPGSDSLPAWSPDGTRIAFVSTRDGNADIFVMNADGSDPVNLTNHPASDSNPAWSPDGTMIAFDSSRGASVGLEDVYVMNADGSDVAVVASSPSKDYDPTWSPGGRRLLFVSQRMGNDDLYIAPIDNSMDATNLTNNRNADDFMPMWLPVRVAGQ